MSVCNKLERLFVASFSSIVYSLCVRTEAYRAAEYMKSALTE